MSRSPYLTAVLFIIVLLLAAVSARAGVSSRLAASPETLADTFLAGLAGRVALSPEERAAVRPILIEQMGKRQELVRVRLAATPGMAGMLALRKDLRAITRETDAKLSAVLPPEKMEAVKAFREERLQQARQQGVLAERVR